MSTHFPVIYSLLSSDALCNLVEETFDIGQVHYCKMLNRGLNDTYILATKDNRRYIIRVYRTPWRSHRDVEYEVNVLDLLVQHGVSVSHPIRNRNGGLTSAVNAPEGVRDVVLFTYAEGSRARLDEHISYEYGRTMAQIHQATDAIDIAYDRSPLDLRHLLDEPLRVITPAMIEYDGDVAYLESWVQTIHERVAATDWDFGFCHGDCHDWNAHWNGHTLTMFDFDCSGPGYRIYDLAVFLWNLKTHYKETEMENWKQFVQGYRTGRALTDQELTSILWFVAARRIWLAGIYLANEDVFGAGIINEGFFHSLVEQLRDDEKELGISIR